ncbi:hypothetical protein [Bradyrhizobium sp. HKCCYLR20261]|uniref:hypothetical protein n=1 Tax=Bradyrhizobium sp. HKCCYLR20261 TaxID=3420760 RepID=UPI003EBE24F4
MKLPTAKGFQVPDGNEILKSDIPAVAELIARTARWVHPDTFRALPVWAPHAARGQPLFDSEWSRRYTNTRKATGITSEKFEGNVAAAQALFAALDVQLPRPKNWSVCHIWGYDDPNFAEHTSVVRDRRYFSCVANMVWLPTSLKGFTDTLPEIKAMLRVCAFHLYGWTCEHESVAAQALQVRSGWIPLDYPKDWPDGSGEVVLPPGTAPFTPRVEQKISKRKAAIRYALSNASYLNYPRDEVAEVLQFWKIDLG